MVMTLYDLTAFAMIGWALMIVLPFWSFTKRLVEWSLFPVAVSAIYVVGIIAVLSETGLGIASDFGNAEGVLRLLAQPDIALIAWIHILAFDHLVAVVIFRDNLRHRVVPLPIQSVILFMTLMFGPAGFLTYWTVRVARGRGTDFGGGSLAAGPDAVGSEPAMEGAS